MTEVQHKTKDAACLPLIEPGDHAWQNLPQWLVDAIGVTVHPFVPRGGEYIHLRVGEKVARPGDALVRTPAGIDVVNM